MSRPYTSSGGTDGVYANRADLVLTAGHLGTAASDLGRLAAQSRSNAASGALLRTAIFSPGSAASSEAHLIEAAASAHVVVAMIGAEALFLQAKADLFALADEIGTRIRHTAQDLLAIPVFIAVVVAAAGPQIFRVVGDELADVITGRTPLSELDNRLKQRLFNKKLVADIGKDVAEILAEHPEITEIITGGLPTALTGGVPAVLNRFGADLPDSIEDLIGVAQGIAKHFGMGIDAPVSARADGEPIPSKKGVRESFSSIISSVSGIEASGDHSGVNIKEVDGPNGTVYIVEIPGTSDWDPTAGGNPSDLTQNGELMRGRGSLLEGVRQAMELANIPPGAPVMLAGHSQGGIAAVALAADAGFRQRFNVTNVLTAGSPMPITHGNIPPSVHVLSLEHSQDAVHGADGDPNLDRANRQTLRFDNVDYPDAIKAHNANGYAHSAESIDMHDVHGSFNQFLGGDVTTQRYELTRDSPAPASTVRL